MPVMNKKKLANSVKVSMLMRRNLTRVDSRANACVKLALSYNSGSTIVAPCKKLALVFCSDITAGRKKYHYNTNVRSGAKYKSKRNVTVLLILKAVQYINGIPASKLKLNIIALFFCFFFYRDCSGKHANRTVYHISKAPH